MIPLPNHPYVLVVQHSVSYLTCYQLLEDDFASQ